MEGLLYFTQINLDWNNVKTEKTGPSLNEGIVAPQSTPPPKKMYFSLAIIHSAANYLYVG